MVEIKKKVDKNLLCALFFVVEERKSQFKYRAFDLIIICVMIYLFIRESHVVYLKKKSVDIIKTKQNIKKSNLIIFLFYEQ
mgnify:CR=1 FL=1